MSRRTGGALATALVAVVSAAVAISITVGASAVASHNDPSANTSLPTPVLSGEVTACRAEPIDDSAACVNAILAEINYARGTEGVGAMTLPSNWSSLTVPEQTFVVVDLERVARGQQPLLGLSFIWNVDAEIGADANVDPPLPTGYPWVASIWAGGPGNMNPLEADYVWMYDDGFGGPNIDCETAGASGCWVHRESILSVGSCTTCIMGAGYADVRGAPSLAAVIVEPVGAAPSLAFTWANNVAPYLGRAVSVAPAPVAAKTAPSGSGGYREVARDGGLFAFSAPYDGSMGGSPLDAPVVGMAADLWTGGYWEVASDGGIFNFDAPFFGSMGGQRLSAPIVGIAADVATGGYWEVASDGGVFAFHAPFYGSMGGHRLSAPIVGIAADPATGGYWEVARDGGVFAFHAPFYGSMGGHRLSAPVVGIALDPWSGGYWEVASDGGVFAYHAPFFGSMGGTPLVRPVVGIAADPGLGGYWEVASDGGVFSFDAPFFGSEGGTALQAPVVGIAP
jgi:hypothetical protein